MAVQNLPFIQNMERRIQSACLLLDASLGHCFVDGLEHRDDNAIYNCLRAYAAIDNTSNAEEIFRSTIVAPEVKRIIAHNLSGLSVETSGDELEADYTKIIQFIEENCKFLLEISSRGMTSISFKLSATFGDLCHPNTHVVSVYIIPDLINVLYHNKKENLKKES